MNQKENNYREIRQKEELKLLKTLDKIKDTHYIFDKRFIQGPLRDLLVSYGTLLDKEGYYEKYYTDPESRRKSKEILKKTLKDKYESFLRIRSVVEQNNEIYDILIILGGNSEHYHRSFRKKKLRQFLQKCEVSYVLLTKDGQEQVKIGEDPTRKEN